MSGALVPPPGDPAPPGAGRVRPDELLLLRALLPRLIEAMSDAVIVLRLKRTLSITVTPKGGGFKK